MVGNGEKKFDFCRKMHLKLFCSQYPSKKLHRPVGFKSPWRRGKYAWLHGVLSGNFVLKNRTKWTRYSPDLLLPKPVSISWCGSLLAPNGKPMYLNYQMNFGLNRTWFGRGCESWARQASSPAIRMVGRSTTVSNSNPLFFPNRFPWTERPWGWIAFLSPLLDGWINEKRSTCWATMSMVRTAASLTCSCWEITIQLILRTRRPRLRNIPSEKSGPCACLRWILQPWGDYLEKSHLGTLESSVIPLHNRWFLTSSGDDPVLFGANLVWQFKELTWDE